MSVQGCERPLCCSFFQPSSAPFLLTVSSLSSFARCSGCNLLQTTRRVGEQPPTQHYGQSCVLQRFIPPRNPCIATPMASTTATMTLPSPSTSTRPTYLDNLFKDSSHSINKTPSLRSAYGSISSKASSSDSRTPHSPPRPLSPAYEEQDQDDRSSIRSLKLQFSPRRSFRNLLNRRTYPQVKEMVDMESSSTTPPPRPEGFTSHSRQPSSARSLPRRPSLPKMSTSLSLPKSQAPGAYATKPLPPAPVSKAPELQCQPCYYFAARNCNGYVLGGAHGDSCENCLVRISSSNNGIGRLRLG